MIVPFSVLQVSESYVLQVATMMGFEDELYITDDIGATNMILASGSWYSHLLASRS
jgi:hypothetical protein